MWHFAAQKRASPAKMKIRLPVAEMPCRQRRDLPAGELNAANRLQSRAWMDFGLRQNGGLLPEALHQRAHEGTDRSRRYQYRRFAFACGLFEAVAHDGHELRQF